MLRSGARVLGVVPARAGSKGVAGKNLRPLAGLPLVAHAIRCAAQVKEVDAIVVSTDSHEIARISREHGALVPFMRPAELATDEARLEPVLRHAHEEMERHLGHELEVVLLLQPTTPARRPDDIARALRTLDDDADLDGVAAVSEPPWNPFYVGVVLDDAGHMRPAFAGLLARRQEAPRFLRVNGSFYAWRRRWIARNPDPHWLDAPHRPLIVDDEWAVDIDTPADFERLEHLLHSGRVKLPWL